MSLGAEGSERDRIVEEIEKREREGEDQAIANLGATVRSLSNLALFLSKACCRQSSRLLQL